MSTIYCSTIRCNRTAHGRRTPDGQPLCAVCAAVYADAEQSIPRLILDARRAGVEDTITGGAITKGIPS